MTSAQVSRPTLNDVALAAGVSRSTVSLVLRNAGHISPATRTRVRATMEQMGYVYNRGAASMRGGSTRSIGIVAPDSSNLFMGEFISAVELQMLESSFVTLSCHSFEDPARQDALIRSLLERGIDAIAVMPAVDSTEQLTATLATVDVPVVVVVRPLPGADFTYVGPDNVMGGSLAAEHLVGHGCRTIGYLGGAATLTPREDRVRGVRSTLTEGGGILAVDQPSAPTGVGGMEAMSELLRRGELPDGLICHNDSVAFGAFRALRASDPALLDRVRVIGFDDVAEAALWEPPLTTLSANAEDVGQATVEVLLRMLGGNRQVESVSIPPRLIVRESCGDHPDGV